MGAFRACFGSTAFVLLAALEVAKFRSHRRNWLGLARRSGIALALSALGGCGPGFHAISWDEDSEAIVSVVNESAFSTSDTLTYIPLAMPALSPNDPKAASFKVAGARAEVQPYNLAPDVAATTADGVVELADTAKAPYKSVGRLEGRFPGAPPGYGHTCTAQLISTDGVALTAAHCVYSQRQGGWAERMQFRLRYDQGSAAQTYDWQCMGIVRGWIAGRYPFDYAFVKLRGVPQSGLGLRTGVGGAHVDAVGYPARYYSSERMVHVAAQKDGNNPSRMHPNDMLEGSSGGAWINASNQAVSLNSFYYTNDRTSTYGPQFSAGTLALYEHVRRGCSDQVRLLGAATREPMALLLATSAAHTVMGPTNEDIAVAARLERTPNPQQCPCGGHDEERLINLASETRVVGLRTTLGGGDGQRTLSRQERLLLLKPKEAVSLGCAIVPSPKGGRCTAARDHLITYDHRAGATAVKAFSLLASAGGSISADARAFTGSDIKACAAACTGTTTASCGELGSTAIATLAPLGKFVDLANGAGADPDGTLITHTAIIAEFGGDPATQEDPCLRTDVRKSAASLINDGLKCSIRSKKLFPQSASLTTHLLMRDRARGEPASWNSAAAGSLIVFFNNRVSAPAIEFEGQDAANYNWRYAGDVHAITRSGPRRLVLATSNGCLSGFDKAP